MKWLTATEMPPTAESPCKELSLISSEWSGRDDVLLILGLNIFVKDNVLKAKGLSWTWASPLSFSKDELRNLKLRPWRRFLIGCFSLDENDDGDLWAFAYALLEEEPGVGSILILTEFIEDASILLGGTSMERFGRFPWWEDVRSSTGLVILLSPYQSTRKI